MKTREISKRVRETQEDQDTGNGSGQIISSNPRASSKQRQSHTDADSAAQPITAQTAKVSSPASRKKQKNLTSESSPAAQEADSVDSEDEGPEEMSMGAARAQAEAAESQRKLRLGSLRRKGKLGKGGAEKNTEKESEDEAGPSDEAQGDRMGHDKDDHGMIEEADDDILPDSVIEALQNQRREGPKASASTAKPPSTSSHQPAISLSEDFDVRERQTGRVRVAILDPQPVFAPSVAAREYASQRLYGMRHARSREMLDSVSGRRQQVQWDKGIAARKLRA